MDKTELTGRVIAGCMGLSLLAACGQSDPSGDEAAARARAEALPVKVDPCFLLSKESIRAAYPDVDEVILGFQDREYPSCALRFTAGGTDRIINIIYARGQGGQAALQQSMSQSESISAVEDLGAGALYAEEPVNQVSVWVKDDLFELVLRDAETGKNDQDQGLEEEREQTRERVIAFAREVAEQLD